MKKLKKIVVLVLLFACVLPKVLYAKVSPSSKMQNNKNVDVENFVINENSDIDTALLMYQKLEHAILKNSNSQSVQHYLDNYLTSMAGMGAEWYVILFYKLYGDTIDYKKYKEALDRYVLNNKNLSKTTMQLIALSYLCIDKDNTYLKNVCDETIGMQGIMSFIFGLHLLNNNLPSTKWTKDMVIEKIINMCDKEKGYSFMGNETDIDVTSMVIQVLSPYYSDAKVKNTIDNCINIISKSQLSDGTFVNSGLVNSESISQVILMASTMEIDVESDYRFVKNNINLYMALSKFNTSDGLYSHILDNNSNILATQQASYALGSMVLYKTKKENLFKIR